MYCTLKTKKGYLLDSPLWKPKKSAPFSRKRPDIIRICLRYKVNQLSWVIFISHWSQKRLEREIYRVCSVFYLFIQSRKKSTFLYLSLFRLFGGQLSKKGENPNLWTSQLTAVKKWQEILSNPDIYIYKCLCIITHVVFNPSAPADPGPFYPLWRHQF